MKTKQRKPAYQQWWFWGLIVAVLLAGYFILNIDQIIAGKFEPTEEIYPYTREVGSGTRTAFTEATGLVDEDGNDIISPTVTVQNSTNAITQTVSNDPHAIGYISLGSLNDSVKALAVDEVEPTRENIREGDYQLVRGFNVVYGQTLSDVAQDFWNFMFSREAQEIVEEAGFVSIDADAPEYEGGDMSGSITIVGSTSVEPVMQLFTEAYGEYNPDVTIDITAPGSGAGITTAIEGSADIGMSSREPDAEELDQLIASEAIALDGIVMIVNNQNPLESINSLEIQSIYLADYDTGITWADVLENQ